MKYIPPQGGAPDDAYVNHNINLGIEGSIPVAEAFEHPQREIVHAIEAAGMTPDGNDLTQLSRAIKVGGAYIVQNATFDPAVIDKDVVYFDAVAGTYKKALAPTHAPDGIADLPNLQVYVGGQLPDDFFTGLTVSRYYSLSSVSAGQISLIEGSGAVKIGTALAANRFLLDINSSGSSGFLFTNSQTFLANGTFTAPKDIILMRVFALGGGGGGGGTSAAPANGGGGGHGGWNTITLFNITAGTSLPVTVGAGGIGGSSSTAGTDGGSSGFGGVQIAGGGHGGPLSAQNSAYGTAGSYYTNPPIDLRTYFSFNHNSSRSQAQPPLNIHANHGSGGGTIHLMVDNTFGYLPNGGTNADGTDGIDVGDGGGGGGGSYKKGGNGVSGRVVVEW
ncbi:MAG: glycine-rich domain-containing protein [Sneathiella sp.]